MVSCVSCAQKSNTLAHSIFWYDLNWKIKELQLS